MELNPQQDRHILETTISDPKLWSPEWPNLYQVEISLIDDQEETIHTIMERFGFRTIELNPNDGFYLNGERIMFRGINRHTFWPESGRTTSKDLSIKDVKQTERPAIWCLAKRLQQYHNRGNMGLSRI